MGADPASEELFGPYIVYERLGVGGMATVHRALERGADGFERMVALKRLLPHLAEDASFIKSFVREAKLASLLSHINIVQIYELGRVGTAYFISMEYIDGRDVRQVLRHARKVTGPPPLHVTVGILIQLCDALDYAHNKSDDDGHPLGLVHRDVSPSNLLVTSAGHLKVIDFGIAKAESSQLRTATGRVKGKLAYMAPEAVAGGRDLDARSDIWACGVILHEMLTARPLFASKNEYQTLLKVQRGDIMPPSTFNQACPAELDAIVFKALARDPNERFTAAADMRDELFELRRQYQLQTGYRDVSQWLHWAFAQEAPAPPATGSGVGHPRGKTPRPKSREEDEAVEVAWGGGSGIASGPVELEDVPDVSDKFPLPRADTEVAEDDDIPTPLPQHGPDEALVTGPMPQPRAKSTTAPGVAVPRTTTPRTTTPPVGSPIVRQSERMPTVGQRPSDRQPAQQRPSDRQPAQQRPSDRQPVQRPSDRQPAQRSLPPLPRADSAPSTTPEGRALSEPMTDPLASPAATQPFAKPIGAHELGAEAIFDDAAPTINSSSQLPASDPEPVTHPAMAPLADPGSKVPVVRFTKNSSTPPANITNPGLGVIARPPSVPPGTQVPHQLRARRPSNVHVGAGMIERQKTGKKMWLIGLAGMVIAGGAAAAIVMAMRGGDQAPAAAASDTGNGKPGEPAKPVEARGKLKFIVEPQDAEVLVEGQPAHAGSPWSIELAPGSHPIEVRKSGYKSWLTSLELGAGESQVVRVELAPLGATTAGDATLSITTTPAGLEVVIDGKVQVDRTPLKMPLRVGPHVLAVRQNGAEIWSQKVNAEPASDYEFHPTVGHVAPRAPAPVQKPQAKASATTAESHGTTETEPASDGAKKAPEPATSEDKRVDAKPTGGPSGLGPRASGDSGSGGPKPEVQAPMAPPPPTTIAPAPTTVAPAPPPARPAGPIVVAPTAVTKLSGETPSLQVRASDLPPVVAAKLCIDTSGNVTSADIMSKIEHHAASDLAEALAKWHYAPYKKDGVAVAVCFAVSFRLR